MFSISPSLLESRPCYFRDLICFAQCCALAYRIVPHLVNAPSTLLNEWMYEWINEWNMAVLLWILWPFCATKPSMTGGNMCFQVPEALTIHSEADWEEEKNNQVENLLWTNIIALLNQVTTAAEKKKKVGIGYIDSKCKEQRFALRSLTPVLFPCVWRLGREGQVQCQVFLLLSFYKLGTERSGNLHKVT